jgi:hypothetical protein
MIEPLSISFEVECSADHAFDTWTQRIDTWWPPEHKATEERHTTVVLERQLGGRLFERTPAGEEHEWGRVTTWEPRRRFGYLWHIRRDASDATDVEIRFSEVDEGRARVDILHSGWERLGDGGPDWRERNQGGWSGVIPYFVAAAETI